MTPQDHRIITAIGGACLAAAIGLLLLGQTNRRLQEQALAQERDAKLLNSLAHDTALLSVRHPELRETLARLGIQVNIQPQPGQPGGAP
ncbi:MAG: hypothetical protein WC789_00965 [Lentisphaeria bacterium]|jgi:hypothetical protein